MTRGRLAMLAGVGLIGIAAAGWAAEPALDVHLDPQRLGVEDVARLTITVSGGKVDGETPRPGGLENLVIVGGPSTETQFSWVNGVSSSSISFVYVLQPQGLGPGKVGPVTVRVDGKELRSEPIDVVVVGGSVARARTMRRLPGNPLEQLLGRPQRRRARVALHLLAPKQKLWVGEPVPVALVLDATAAVAGFEWVAPPAFPGWWTQRVDPPERVSGTMVERNGVQYLRYPLVKYVIIPLKAGRLTVPAARARVGLRSMSVFDSGQQQVSATRPSTFEVLERPQPAPGFSGAVGALTYTAQLSPKRVRYGDPVSLSIRLAGDGNLPLAGAPAAWPVCTTCQSYPPEEESSVQVDEKGIHGQRIWTTTLVPKQWGRLRLAPVALAVFNPVSAEYSRQRVGPFEVEVEPPPTTPTPTVPAVARRAAAPPVRVTGRSPAPANNGVPWRWIAGALLAGVLLGAGVVVFLRRRSRGRIPAPSPGQPPAERARELQGVLERWWAGVRESHKSADLEGKVADLRSDLESIRFAPGRADHTETLREAEGELRSLLRRA